MNSHTKWENIRTCVWLIFDSDQKLACTKHGQGEQRNSRIQKRKAHWSSVEVCADVTLPSLSSLISVFFISGRDGAGQSLTDLPSLSNTTCIRHMQERHQPTLHRDHHVLDTLHDVCVDFIAFHSWCTPDTGTWLSTWSRGGNWNSASESSKLGSDTLSGHRENLK